MFTGNCCSICRWTVPVSRAIVSEPPDLSTDRCAGPQMLICPPSTRSMRAVPELTRTLLPLRRTVFDWPRTTSTLMGPVTLIASPSMIPTESEGGSSGRAAAAAISAAQRMATHAAGTAARRERAFELEQAVTRGYSQPRTQKVSPILYVGGVTVAREVRSFAAAHRNEDDTRRNRRGHEEIRRGTSQCALRHPAAGLAVVAAHPDSDHRRGSVQRDSNAGSDASLRSAWLAPCGACACIGQEVHLGVLAPDHYPDCVVAPKPRRRGDEHHGVRRAVDAQSDRVAGIRHGARQFVARRTARAGGDGAAAA